MPKEHFEDGLYPEVRKALENAIGFYRSAGHEIVEVSLEMTKYVMPAYYIIVVAEISSNLARFDGIRNGFRSKAVSNAIDIYLKTRGERFGEEVKCRIMLGTYVLSNENFDSYYRHA